MPPQEKISEKRIKSSISRPDYKNGGYEADTYTEQRRKISILRRKGISIRNAIRLIDDSTQTDENQIMDEYNKNIVKSRKNKVYIPYFIMDTPKNNEENIKKDFDFQKTAQKIQKHKLIPQRIKIARNSEEIFDQKKSKKHALLKVIGTKPQSFLHTTGILLYISYMK